VALLPEEHGPVAARSRTGAAASAAWVAATVERLGAQAVEASCRNPDPRRFIEKLEMFVGECELVVVGFLSPALCEAVRLAQVRHRQPAWIETLRPRPLGALQVVQVGKTLVAALSAGLESAVATFTTLLTPLIRRLQGRHDILPAVRAAELDGPPRHDDARWRLVPAQVDPGALSTRVLLKPCAGEDAARALASADGLAWHATEFASFDRPTVGWFPFDTWSR
jgi:molybdopterin molybdotransferase